MKIINPNEIGSKISTLISESQENFIVVSPYLDLSKWRKILINLENAIKRGVKIKFYFREIKDKDFNVLNNLGIELIKIEGLHTKLYFNESEVIVSSMNLYEFSDLYSIDIAMYFNEPEEYNKIYDYFKKYIASKNSKKIILNNNNNNNSLESLHNQLTNRFSESTINKTSSYLYTKNLVPIFDLFIELNGFTIKYPRKGFDKKLIIELEDKIKSVIKLPIIAKEFNFEKDNDYYYWDLEIENNNFIKSCEVITELKKIKIPASIDKSIKFNNSLQYVYSKLINNFPNTSFEDETIYINDISKEIKLFIYPDSITIRFNRDYVTKKFMSKLEDNIKSALIFEIKADDLNGKKNNFYYWEVLDAMINYKNLIEIISALKNVEFPNHLINSIPWKN